MSRRREKTASFRCGEPGCTEYGHYAYTNEREDGRRLYERYGGGKWRCLRHAAVDGEVLSPTNRSRTLVLVSSPDERAPGLFWKREGRSGGSGFAHGPGWMAWTRDFPVGTRIVLRVDVELPEAGS